MWRTLASAVAGLLVLFVGSLAFNAASGQSRWPGPLDYVRVHPWVVLLILIPISLIGHRWRIRRCLCGAQTAEAGGAGAGEWGPGQPGIGADEVEGGGGEHVLQAGLVKAGVAAFAQAAAA